MAILKQVPGVGAIIDYRDRIEQLIAAIEPNQKAIAFNQARLQQQALAAKIVQAQNTARSSLAIYLGQTLLLLLVGITILGITAFDGRLACRLSTTQSYYLSVGHI